MGTHCLGNRLVLENLDQYLQGEGWSVEECVNPEQLKQHVWLRQRLTDALIDDHYERWGPSVWVIDTGDRDRRAWIGVCAPGHAAEYEFLYDDLKQNEVVFRLGSTGKKFRKQLRRMIEFRK